MQNHPNNQVYPVNSYSIFFSVYTQEGLAGIFRRHSLFSNLLLIILLLCSFASVFTVCVLLKESKSRDHLFFIVLAVAVVSTLLLIGLLVYMGRKPAREQQDYYRLAGTQKLSEEQRQALRLEIVANYADGFWNDTLEIYPLKSQVQGHTTRFRYLPLVDQAPYRDQLHADWGILDKTDYMNVIQELWKGMHSVPFQQIMAGENRQNVAGKLANLISETPEYVLSCATAEHPERPPRFVWGFDLLRAIRLSRNAFSAGYINQKQAWEDLLLTASMVYSVFDSFEDFYRNYRLGFSFWNAEYSSAVKKRQEYLDYLEHCQWPAKQLPWPRVTTWHSGLLLQSDEGNDNKWKNYIT